MLQVVCFAIAHRFDTIFYEVNVKILLVRLHGLPLCKNAGAFKMKIFQKYTNNNITMFCKDRQQWFKSLKE